eukprot:g3763.t1
MSFQLIHRFHINPRLPSGVELHQRKRSSSTLTNALSFNSRELALLDKFWKSRGIRSAQDRQDLIQIAQQHQKLTTPSLPQDELLLSGVLYLWNKHKLAHQITCISQSLLELDKVLGECDEIDVVWICLQEPQLLKINRGFIIQRLLNMKLSLSGKRTNILKLIERQPRLLLEYGKPVDLETAPGKQIPAWEHGLMSDRDKDWDASYARLHEFYAVNGHSHVGFIDDGDEIELVNWCSKQRKDFNHGVLSKYKEMKLVELEFEFETIEAEWLRYFCELKLQMKKSTQLMMNSSHQSFLLTNWCSVQRVARKCGQLREERVRKLNELGFDWTASDPLS